MKVISELPLQSTLRHSLWAKNRKMKCQGRKVNIGNLKTFAVHGCTCVRCGRKGDRILLWEDRGGGLHADLYSRDDNNNLMLMNRDHIIPKSKGGEASIWNFQPMCSRCNTKKGNRETAADHKERYFRSRWKKMHNRFLRHYYHFFPKFIRISPIFSHLQHSFYWNLLRLAKVVVKVSS